MKLIRLTLEKIKSYQAETIDFYDGVNFISGMNGAGKTTIIEAVGYALFDSNPFAAQKQFIQKGEKSAKITVVIEAADERQYRVVRTLREPAGGNWAIFDEESGLELQELHGNQDVKAWLAANLGIGRGLDSVRLFEDVIGIPQGRLIMPFLERPKERKKIFNTILQLETYREAFDKSSGLATVFRERIMKKEGERAALAVKVEDLTECRLKLQEYRAQAILLAKNLQTVSQELDAAQVLINHQEKYRAAAEQKQKDLHALSLRLAAISTKKESLQEQVQEAMLSREAAQKSETGYRQYELLKQNEKELQQQRVKKEALNQKTQELKTQLVSLQAALQNEQENRRKQKSELEKELQETREEGARLSREREFLAQKEQGLRLDNYRRLAADKEVLAAMANLEGKLGDTGVKGMCPLLETPCLYIVLAACDTRLDHLRQQYRRTKARLEELEADPLPVVREQELAGKMQQMEEVAEELKRFTGLEDKLQKNQDGLLQYEADYIAYLQYKDGLKKHEALSCDLTALAGEEAAAQQKELELQGELLQVRALYQPEVLVELRNKQTVLNRDKGGLERDLNYAREEEKAYTRKVGEKEETARQIDALTREINRENQAQELLRLVRLTLNQSGEEIAVLYRQHLGREADYLYRQIARENVSLWWGDDYELKVLESQDQKEGGRTFAQLSGGEKMTAALAVRLALLKQMAGLGIGFFDEPTANLDGNRRENLARIIPQVTKQFRQLFVISHDDTFDSITENIIHLQKDASGTKVVS
ncbi:MAG: SMC family ATPase [Clostridia bacterium]|jgi:exonuclease SbcC|nr:SMC family ATPase [Clostridia bacterium]